MNKNLEDALRSLKTRLEKARHITICDPYILHVRRDDNLREYVDRLISVFPDSLVSLTFIHSDNNPDQQLLDEITQKLPHVNVRHFYTREIHDRVWMIDSKRAFTTGTSFNSIGTRVSFINYLNDDDFKAFQEILKQIGIPE